MAANAGDNLTAPRPDTARRGKTGVRLRTVALPTEHGGWGLSLEPVALGLALARAGFVAWLAFFALVVLLARAAFGFNERGR